MRFGFHLSIGGGFGRVAREGRATGCETAQIFSRNPRSWTGKAIDPEDARAFRRAMGEADIRPIAVHLPYLPNLASEDPDLWEKSVVVLSEEFGRADSLGADFVVAHPGHDQGDRARGIERAAEGVIQAIGRAGDFSARLLLETTSGQRGEVGEAFEELAGIIDRVHDRLGENAGLGVCLDTAHIWAAGYDLKGARGQEETLKEFDRAIGLDRLGLIHLNDSLSERGGRRDRHAPVGRGRIGARGMAAFVRQPALQSLPAVMETPRLSLEDDAANMKRLKSWRRRKTRPTRTGLFS